MQRGDFVLVPVCGAAPSEARTAAMTRPHSEKLFMMERIYRNSNCVLLVFEALAIL
jgi:hypothetical protein